ncbi:cyclin-dependent kinase 12-like [Cyprinodon tularosa]|uniref:cyclin-dependent kinase 12-like n=1 Tax=Cyprinodon tularosa TaxID=77115 RepID=UPI0018E25630|nr:cyclin-dependent kinase 12-like [Cyprinodon tularosa]
MYSRRSDYNHRRQDGDRNSRRNREDYDDRRGERHDLHSSTSRDSYHKYTRDGHSSTDRASKSRHYSGSPKRLRSSDSANRDWSRRSPQRRRLSPSSWDVPVDQRRKNTEDKDNYRYRRDSSEKTYRASPSRSSWNQQLRYSPSHEDDVRYRKTSPYSRSVRHREEFPPKRQYEDFSDADSPDRYEAKRRHGSGQERTHSPDYSTKNQAEMRSTSTYDTYYESRASAQLNGSKEQYLKSDGTPQSAARPEEKSSKGFQRFLDILNKGVNVDVLNQIVSQSPKPQFDGRISSSSFVKVSDERWYSGSTEREQKGYADNSRWKESKGSLRSLSPQRDHGSASPNGNQVSVREGSFEAKSPSVEKITMTPEELQKHKQMQDVLQAIGMDLGIEELGQMSHRIQERLYGKRDNEGGNRFSRERSVEQPNPVRCRSRSPSTPSVTSPRQSCYSKRDTREEADMPQSGYSLELNQKSSLEDQGSVGNRASPMKIPPTPNAPTALPFNPIHSVKQLPPPSMPPFPPYPPSNSLPPSYPNVPPPPLPFLPPFGSGNFFPRNPHMLRTPAVPPPPLSQFGPLVPPHTQLLNPTSIHAQQAMNPVEKKKERLEKKKERPRFLQVIK